MSSAVVSFTHTSIGNSIKFPLKIFFMIILSVITLGIYAPFGIYSLGKWFVEGITVDDEPLQMRKATKDDIKDYVILWLIPGVVAGVLALLGMMGFSASYSLYHLGSELLSLVMYGVLIIVILLFPIWLNALYTHFFLSRCTVRNEPVIFEGSAFQYANASAWLFVKKIPHHIFTLGFYAFWFAPQPLELLVSKIKIGKRSFSVSEAFTPGQVFYYSFLYSLFTGLSLGLGACYFALVQFRDILEDFVEVEGDEEEVEQLPDARAPLTVDTYTPHQPEVPIELSVPDHTSPSVEKESFRTDPEPGRKSTREVVKKLPREQKRKPQEQEEKKRSMLPTAIVLSILFIGGALAYLGYDSYQTNKWIEQKRIEQKREQEEREAEEKRKLEERKAEEKRIQDLKNARIETLTNTLSTFYIRGEKSNTDFTAFGTYEKPELSLTIRNDSLIWEDLGSPYEAAIDSIVPESDSTGTLFVNYTGMKVQPTYAINEDGTLELSHLYDISGPLFLRSESDSLRYETVPPKGSWTNNSLSEKLIRGTYCSFKPWKRSVVFSPEKIADFANFQGFYRYSKDGKNAMILDVGFSKYGREESVLYDYSKDGKFQIATKASKYGVRFEINQDTLLYTTDEGSFWYRLGSKEAPTEITAPGKDTPFNPHTTVVSPNGKHAVTYVNSTLWIKNNSTGEIDTIVSDPYGGEWSFGKAVWSPSGDKLYFDNSGPTACIWLYNLSTKILRKIVPEHEAILPQVVLKDGKEYVYYLENGVIKRAVNPDEDELTELIQKIWLTFDNSENACPSFDYYPHGGLRTYFCHMLSYVTVGAMENISGMKVFLSGPHSKESYDFDNKWNFGHYNPKFVQWMLDNLLVSAESNEMRTVVKPLYDKQFKRVVDHLLLVRTTLNQNSSAFDREVKRYRKALAEGNSDEMKFHRFARNLVSKGDIPKEFDWGDPDGYIYDSSIAFWVRRSIDGTDELFEKALRRMKRLYD